MTFKHQNHTIGDLTEACKKKICAFIGSFEQHLQIIHQIKFPHEYPPLIAEVKKDLHPITRVIPVITSHNWRLPRCMWEKIFLIFWFFGSFERHSQKLQEFHDFKLPHECPPTIAEISSQQQEWFWYNWVLVQLRLGWSNRFNAYWRCQNTATLLLMDLLNHPIEIVWIQNPNFPADPPQGEHI